MTRLVVMSWGSIGRLAAMVLPLLVVGIAALAADGKAIPSECKFGNLTFYPTGRILKVSGMACANDQYRFSQFLAALPSRGEVKIVQVQSRGGDADAAISIGYQIRMAGFATLTDATAGDCIGSCAFMFAGGVQRHYVNGDSVAPGVTPLRPAAKPAIRYGLGLQFPFGAKDADAASIMAFFDRFIVPFYQTVLPPASAETTITRMKANQTSDVIVLDGEAAISSGLATSLNPP